MDERSPTPDSHDAHERELDRPDDELTPELDRGVSDRLVAYGAESEPPAREEIPLVEESDVPVEGSVSDAGDREDAIVGDPGSDAEQKRPRRFGRNRGAISARPVKQRSEKRPSKLVGLEIGASQIVAAQVVNNDVPEVAEVFREPLAPGLVVAGEIRDPDALGDVLKRFFDLHKLPKRGIRLGISNNRIGVRVFEISGVSDPAQLENAIRFRAEEVLPIPLDEAVLDYVVLDEGEQEDGTPWRRILLVVAYKEVVDRYLMACRRAGLQVMGIDLEAFAILRSIEAPADRDPTAGALVGVSMGHDRTTIAVSTGRQCEFARVLDWGGWTLNVAIARAVDRAPSEVESIKRQLSFARETEVEGLDAGRVTQAREAMQRALDSFARELVASLQFYQAQPGALVIGEIVLTGGTAQMDGLPQALGRIVGVPVRLGDPFKRVRVGPKVPADLPHGSVAVAIGLGIED